MKIYIIHSEEDLERFRSRNDRTYRVNGSLEVHCNLSLKESIIIKGVLYIKPNRFFEIIGYIKVYGGIETLELDIY